MSRLLRAKKSDTSWALLHETSSTQGGQSYISPEDCILASVESAITMGQYQGREHPEQPIIEVTQAEVKQALKSLQTRQNDIMAVLYKAHDEYNSKYFQGRLSMPLITVEKLSHKTLGRYLASADSAGLENHIVFNRNFVALNTETRLLEELKHEMIHQYQDEVTYEKHDKSGKLLHAGEKRPKDWHNKDFKELSLNVGIVASGRKGYGSPAKMPEPKSYNRKFICKCIASNGYPMTIWSTREVKAMCLVCNSTFTEVKKAGEIIPVDASDVENAGQDAIENRMRGEFLNFEKFKEKYSLTDRVKELKRGGIKYKEGLYQKGHNAYLNGYHYWVAYSVVSVPAPAPKRSSRLKRGAAK